MQRHDLPVIQRGDLIEEQWNKLYPYLPVRSKGCPFKNIRNTVNGILWISWTEVPQRELPPVYGNWNAVYKCFAEGVFESIFKILFEDTDKSIDNSCCKAHQNSAGAKKGGPDTESGENIEMTCGGKNTKTHVVVDGLGNPLYVQLTGGQISDITVTLELLEHINVTGSIVMADRAYGAADFRMKIEESRAFYCHTNKIEYTRTVGSRLVSV